MYIDPVSPPPYLRASNYGWVLIVVGIEKNVDFLKYVFGKNP